MSGGGRLLRMAGLGETPQPSISPQTQRAPSLTLEILSLLLAFLHLSREKRVRPLAPSLSLPLMKLQHNLMRQTFSFEKAAAGAWV